MIIYTWSILGVDTYTEYLGFPDFIYACQWQLTGTEMIEVVDPETGEIIEVPGNSAWVYDRMGFSVEQTSQYIPRDQMTPEIMIGWVQTNLGPEKIAELELQIKEMLEPQN